MIGNEVYILRCLAIQAAAHLRSRSLMPPADDVLFTEHGVSLHHWAHQTANPLHTANTLVRIVSIIPSTNASATWFARSCRVTGQNAPDSQYYLRLAGRYRLHTAGTETCR